MDWLFWTAVGGIVAGAAWCFVVWELDPVVALFRQKRPPKTGGKKKSNVKATVISRTVKTTTTIVKRMQVPHKGPRNQRKKGKKNWLS